MTQTTRCPAPLRPTGGRPDPRRSASSPYPLEDTAPMDLFEPSDSEQAITTATAVLARVERLDQGEG